MTNYPKAILDELCIKIKNYPRFSSQEIEKLDNRFENLKKIQDIFLNCYYDSPNTNKLYEELISDKQTDFSRYNYFYASFLVSSGNRVKMSGWLEREDTDLLFFDNIFKEQEPNNNAL